MKNPIQLIFFLLSFELSMLLRINFANEFFECVMDTFTSARLVVFKKMKGKHDMLLVQAVNVNIKQTI